MLLKGAVRRKQVSKKQCLAERCQGESTRSVPSLTGNKHPDIPCLLCLPVKENQHPLGGKPRQRSISLCLGHTGKPVVPCVTTGEPQSADEAIDNTPPPASCLSPTSEHGRLL